MPNLKPALFNVVPGDTEGTTWALPEGAIVCPVWKSKSQGGCETFYLLGVNLNFTDPHFHEQIPEH